MLGKRWPQAAITVITPLSLCYADCFFKVHKTSDHFLHNPTCPYPGWSLATLAAERLTTVPGPLLSGRRWEFSRVRRLPTPQTLPWTRRAFRQRRRFCSYPGKRCLRPYWERLCAVLDLVRRHGVADWGIKSAWTWFTQVPTASFEDIIVLGLRLRTLG